MRAAPWRRGVWQSLRESLSSKVSPCSSIENESVFAAVFARRRRGLAGGAIDAIEPSEQHGRLIVWIGETVIGPRQLLLRHRVHNVGRDQYHQLGLAVEVVAAREQCAENSHLLQTGQGAQSMFVLLLDHAGHGKRAT